MQNKLFLKAADICELLEVKQTSAYEIIGNLNKELEEQGYLTLATVNIVLVFLVGLSAGFCYLIAGISVVTEVLSIGFGISTDWTMKSAILTTVVFVLLPHIGMGIVAVIEVVKCGL